MAGGGFGRPKFSYDLMALDAAHQEIEILALAESLRGLGRIIGVVGNFAATQRMFNIAMRWRCEWSYSQPSQGSFEFLAFVQWAAANPLISTVVGGLILSLITYIFKRAAGQREEMRQLRGALGHCDKGTWNPRSGDGRPAVGYH